MSRRIPVCNQCTHCPKVNPQWERWEGDCSQGLSVGGQYNGIKLILYPLGGPPCPKFKHVNRYSKVISRDII